MRLGDSGTEVGKIQQQLIEAGETVPPEELASTMFGPGTEAAILDFQAHHVAQSGYPLDIDGVVGPATAWSLEHPGIPGASCKVPGWGWSQYEVPSAALGTISAAASDIGKHEQPDGSNDGPDLTKFNTQGRPWCALAVSEWLREGDSNYQSPWGVLASAFSIFQWGKINGKLVTFPQPGDCFVILRADGHGHVGLICRILPSGDFYTIEGNCGNAVRGGRRSAAGVNYFVRPF
jgi:hypothetical protein